MFTPPFVTLRCSPMETVTQELKSTNRAADRSAWRRLTAVFGAHFLGNLVTIADRILLVPLMLVLWGADLFGVWIIIRSVPAWLSISEMGFASAAGNLMTSAVAAKDSGEAGTVYKTTRWLIGLISIAGLAIAGLICLCVPLSELLHCEFVSRRDFAIAILLACVYTVSIFQTQVLYAAARSEQLHAEVTVQIHVTRMAELALSLLIMWAGGGLIAASCGYLLARWAGIVYIRQYLHQRISWHRDGAVSRELARRMVQPALGYAVLPIVQALQLQGMTMVLAMFSAPSAVLAYNSMRTLARMPQMLGMSIGRTAWPEMTTAIAHGDSQRLRRLYRHTQIVGIGFGVCSLIGLALCGPMVFSVWTMGRVTFDWQTFLLLSAGAAVTSYATTQMSILNAAGHHQTSALFWSVISAVSVCVCYFTGPQLTGRSASLILLVAEVLVCGFVAVASAVCLRGLLQKTGVHQNDLASTQQSQADR